MKISYLILVILILLSNSLLAQTDTTLIYELINKEDTKTLQKLIDKQGINTFESNENSSYLKYAIDNCKLSATEFLIKNKVSLGKNEDETESILENYIGQISCYLEEDAESCMIPAFIMLVENDYIQLKPTLLGKLNCYTDVLPEWYSLIQPLIKVLIAKELKVEEAIIHITGKKESYLLETCKWEKECTKEGYKDQQKAIRKYILFLKEQGVDFNSKIKGKRPVDLLSKKFQKEIR